MLSIWIECKYSKEEILSAYLNHVYFGAGAYGLHSAANVYFDKAPANLGVKEAALLAGLVQAPSRLAPTHNPEGAIKRMKVVLKSMEDQGYASEGMIADARNIKIQDGKVQGMDFVSREKNPRYFSDWIVRQVNSQAGDISGNLKVITTLNPNLQNFVADTLQNELDSVSAGENTMRRPEGAAIILDNDGAIRALVGGYVYEISQFNRATDGMRQAGSSFKPFVYLAALEQGWKPNSLISNERFTRGTYRPGNYDGTYSENATLREALARSYNVSAVRLAQEIGVPHIIDVAKRVGIDANVREELSTALGTVDISLLDLTGGYATIGQKGRLVTPYGIQRIENEDGVIVFEHKQTSAPKVIATRHADALISMMQDVVDYGTAQRAKTGFPVAGKTGTTQDYRDALFLGFSSNYTMGVWIGYDDNTSMPSGTYGGGIPATIWRKSMQTAHANVPARAVSNYAGSGFGDNTESFINRLFSGNDGNSGGFFGGGRSANDNDQIRRVPMNDNNDYRRRENNNANDFNFNQ
jgi:penicillin-binding protein 1A